ncbi:hypothetical protein JXR93_00370 [bacterium]|nr:hypothetical protein [bacterium]
MIIFVIFLSVFNDYAEKLDYFIRWEKYYARVIDSIHYPKELLKFKNHYNEKTKEFENNCYHPKRPLEYFDEYVNINQYSCVNFLGYPYFMDYSKLSQKIELAAFHFEQSDPNVNGIGDLENLKEILLSGKGLKTVDFVKKLKNLQRLYLLNTDVSEKDLENLIKSNDKIDIFLIDNRFYDYELRYRFENYKKLIFLDPKVKTPAMPYYYTYSKEFVIKKELNENYKYYTNSRLLGGLKIYSCGTVDSINYDRLSKIPPTYLYTFDESWELMFYMVKYHDFDPNTQIEDDKNPLDRFIEYTSEKGFSNHWRDKNYLFLRQFGALKVSEPKENQKVSQGLYKTLFYVESFYLGCKDISYNTLLVYAKNQLTKADFSNGLVDKDILKRAYNMLDDETDEYECYSFSAQQKFEICLEP